MRVYKSLERKSWILGLPLNQIGLLLCLFLVLTIAGSLAGILIKVSWLYYLLAFSSVLSLYLLLRKAANKQHPDYLLSFLSFRFFQPQNIRYENPTLSGDPTLSRDHA